MHPPPPADAEARLLDFDRAWQQGQEPRLQDYLPSSADAETRLEILRELIKIDLEYRWRRGSGSGPRLEQYAEQFPELGPVAQWPLELIAAEYEARKCWGDRPALEEFEGRFPEHGPALRKKLRQVDAQLSQEGSSATTRTLSISPPPSNGTAGPPASEGMTVPQLLDEIRGFQLLSVEQMNELDSSAQSKSEASRERPVEDNANLALAPVAHAPGSPITRLMRDLVARGWLSPFQANQLTLGLGAELRIGSYLLLDYLGEGATGRVYKARDLRDEQIVALKVIRKELLAAPEVVARFHREVELARRLDHPNLVRSLDAGPVGGVLILAMEYVEGTDLTRLIKQDGPLAVDRAIAYIRQAAAALQYAHERGLVHRDVKPSNLMVTRDGQIKLLDLGLARFRRNVDDDTSHTLMETGLAGTMTPIGSVMMGTPDYMAPEQALDFHKADVRADIYSLGCTFYFLLTGRPPFAGSTLTAKLLQHQQTEPAALTQFRSDVPDSVVDLLARMLAKSPEDRPQTPGQVVTVLDGTSTLPPPKRTLTIPIRRPPRPRVGTARFVRASLLLLVLGLGVTLAALIGFRPPTEPPTTPPVIHGSLSVLLARAADPDTDMAALRRDIVTFRAASAGSADARAAAELLMRLPSPLDRLTKPSIPAAEQFADAPAELIAVLGERRFRHRGSVEALAFTSDGKALLSGGTNEGVIHVWDPERRAEQTTLRPPSGAINTLVFSPDGQTLASGGDNNVRLWDAGTWRERDSLRGHSNTVLRLAFSRDGTRLASASADKTIKLWDLSSGQELHTLGPFTHPAAAVNFTADGRELVLASHDKTVRLYDTATGRETRLLLKHNYVVMALAVSPDGTLLAGGCEDGRLFLWDVAGWNKRKELKHGTTPGASVRSLTFTPDGKTLATGGRDGAIRLWDVSTWTEKAALPGHVGYIQALAFTADGTLLASGGSDGTLRLWHPRTGREVTPGHGHAGTVHALAFAPDGSTLATGGLDLTARLWNLSTLRETRQLTGHTGPVFALAYDPLGQILASGSYDGTVRFWNVATGLGKNPWSARGGQVAALAFNPAGTSLAVGTQQGFVKPLDPVTIKDQTTFPGHKRMVTGLAFAPSGATLASAEDDGMTRLLDPRNGKELTGWPSRTKRPVRALAYAPDGKLLASALGDGSVSLWDVTAERERTALAGHSGEVLCLSFRADGRMLATGGSDGRVVLWDPASGTKLAEWLLPAHVSSIAFAPDGRHLATGNSNGAVYLFRLAKP